MHRPIAAVIIGAAVAAGAIVTASAQANLDANKSPAQMFAQGCSACHRTPHEPAYVSRALLLQHYTTGPQQAEVMATYLEAVRSAPARAKPRRSTEADVAEVVSTGSIEADPAAAVKPEVVPAPVPLNIEE